MIILFNGYGNNSNRLFQNLHFEAFCIENEIVYSNPSFNDLRNYYVSPGRVDGNFSARILGYIPARLIDNIPSFFNVKLFNKINDSVLISEEILVHKNYYVAGWSFRVNDLTKKYQNLLASRYSIKKEYYHDNAMYNYIMGIDRSKFSLIGIHVRRGDYKYFAGGKYYFSDNVYEKYIKMMSILVEKTGRQALFIIFSNDAVELQDSNSVRFSKNPWYVDHHLMSNCDYLLGPPSTFTLWASYIGRVKYFHLQNDGHQLSLNDFEYCYG